MILLNNAKIEANDSPEHLFKHPKTPLVASFFDEFNVIKNEIVYAHQLNVVEKSNIKVTVSKSYFKGNYSLIESRFENETIFFEYSEKLPEGRIVYLDINK